MPINESAGIRRSSLTKEQKREAEAAIYGLSKNHMLDISQLTPEDIEKLRTMLAASDGKQGKVNEFDLNNPPKMPYVHKEFPKAIYHHEKRAVKAVQNASELEEHLDRGWNREPFLPDTRDDTGPELDDAAIAEAAAIDSKLNKKRK